MGQKIYNERLKVEGIHIQNITYQTIPKVYTTYQ